MDPILSAILGSVHADLARVDRVGMNIANLQTPGYKREVVAALPFASRVDAATVAVHTDQRPGSLKTTGQSLDFALSGPGWFEVATPAGLAYTRQGNFRLDASGRLVTQQGDPVMGAGGEIVLAHPTPRVDGMGRVFEAPGGARDAGAPVAQLKIVRFEPGPVQRLGQGLVLPQGSPIVLPGDATQVRQGFLENSNVSSMREMVSLLESVRHLETLQKVALGYDEMLGTGIRKLGEVS